MSRYFDDELTHSGVKGMKWRKHKYRLVKDANGKLRYVYDNDNTARNQTNGNAAARRMQQETQAKRILADVIKKGGDPNHSYTVVYTDKDGKHISGKYMPNEKSLSAVSFDKNGKVSPVYSKAAKELMADNTRKYERRKRTRQAEANKEQVERRKRLRQAEANKEQIEKRKKDQRVANNYKAKATGKRTPYNPDNPYGTNQTSRVNEQNRARQHRQTTRAMEGFLGRNEGLPHPWAEAGPGQKARAAESTARHEAAVKAQKKKKNKVADTIDRGRKAVEEFFKPKKKKKR